MKTYFEIPSSDVEETKQFLSDFVVKRLVDQGDRCVDGTGQCCYTDGENHCAVGWIWPDPPENTDVPDLVENYALETPDLIKENLYLFSLLQDFHDSNKESYRFDLLKEFADIGINTEGQHWMTWVEMAEFE